ncbi:MAG TPA: GntR family transcriptional regulator [Pyrinomonadaceae bacterium]|jgi:GntR family transcriptional regulator|nr:GntR family transcriptional regulator [Pyrinomonadaceae bacterium]
MYITIDERDKRPLYQQVVDEIKGLIAAGELPEGSSLPPVRQVAADLGVNLNTIAYAYRQLQKEGLVKVRHGAGAVVTSRLLRERTEEQLRGHLGTALTHLALAGLKLSEVRALVETELGRLFKEGEQERL